MPYAIFSFCVFRGWMVKNSIAKSANINVKAAVKVKICHRKNLQDKNVSVEGRRFEEGMHTTKQTASFPTLVPYMR